METNGICKLLVPRWAVVAAVCSGMAATHAQWPGREAILRDVEKTFGDPPELVRLDPQERVWADKKHQRVVVDGYIALQQGSLEMLACLAGTKEHESIVATFCKAQTVHAGLLAIGAKAGKPVQWQPDYVPPSGSEIQVMALWRDENGEKQRSDVRRWCRVVGSQDKTLEANFVFAGSILWEDPDTGKKMYQAEGGDLICVSNFSTATLDVPLESSAVNTGLMFAAFSERIPKVGTPIRLVLQLVVKTPAAGDSDPLVQPPAVPDQTKSLDKL